MTTYALIDESKGVNDDDLHGMALALEVNAKHCADAWNVGRPTVEMWTKKMPLPADHWPIYFMDESSADPNTLAVHYVGADGRPEGRVYVGNASGLNNGANSITEAASHELVEMMINPFISKWADMPGRSGWDVAQESADPVQDHYEIEVFRIKWRVSNFVYPAWFGWGGERMDHLGTLSHPGEIGPVGYAILRDQAGRVEYVFGSQKASHMASLRSVRVVQSAGRKAA